MTYAEQIHNPDTYAARTYDDARQQGLSPDAAERAAREAHAQHAHYAARIARAAVEHAADLADQLRDALQDAATTAARAQAYATGTYSRLDYQQLRHDIATAKDHAKRTETATLTALAHAETAVYYETVAHKDRQRYQQPQTLPQETSTQ